MLNIIRTLLAALALSVSTQVVSARQQVVEVKFPDMIPFSVVIRDSYTMDQKIESVVNPKNPSITKLEFEEFKDQARAREVIVDTSELCARFYDYDKGRWFIGYYVRYVYFKGNRMYYTDTTWSEALKAAVRPRTILGCQVHSTQSRMRLIIE